MFNSSRPLTKLSATAALQMLQAGKALQDYHIQGRLNLLALSTDDIYFPHPLVVQNCWVDNLYGPSLSYKQTVELRNTRLAHADFTFSYFLKGLTVEGCLFDDYLNFQAGGHNKPSYPVCLVSNTFNKFVNFFDCWYEFDVQVEGNAFVEGTNLLGAPFGIPVSFHVPPVVQHNTGDLYRNDEGDTPS